MTMTSQQERTDLGTALDGAHALVTAASNDIGRAIAIELSRLGATVALVGRTARTLQDTADRMPGPAHILTTDLTQADSVDAMVEVTRAVFDDRLDVLVHGAGVYGQGPMELTPIDELDRLYEANVRAPYRLTQEMLPLLKKQQGQVVFINSTQALTPRGEVGAYAATKHALRAIADSLRDEVNKDGVRVLTVHLGRTATSGMQRIYAQEGREYQPELLLQPVDVARTIGCCVTLGRTAEVTNMTIRPSIKSY